MRKTLILTAIAALAFTSVADAKSCRDPATHRFAKCATSTATRAAPMSAMTPSQMAAMPAGGAPHCKKGKPCGHSCIAVSKVCHK